MTDAEDSLVDSPADFDSSLAYALHPEMRRLIIVWIVGALVTPVGIRMLLRPRWISTAIPGIVVSLVGLVVAVVGATLLFGGLVGALFKLVTDANIVAATQSFEREE